MDDFIEEWTGELGRRIVVIEDGESEFDMGLFVRDLCRALTDRYIAAIEAERESAPYAGRDYHRGIDTAIRAIQEEETNG